MTEEEKKKKQPDAFEQSVGEMKGQSAKLREYAASPINVNTKGQTDWAAKLDEARREYMESDEQRAARQKRERTNRRMAALADGLAAIGNVAGAMAGATPARLVSMSEAHRKAVERAAAHRRENARLYDTASRYYLEQKYKQDKDNATRYDAERKARQDASKQADAIDMNILKLTQARESAGDRLAEQKRHNERSESLSHERNQISRERNAISAAKRGKSEVELQEAYDYWESLTPAQKQQYREWNNRTGTEAVYDVNTEKWVYKDKPDDKNFIKHVWEQRKGYLRNHGGKNREVTKKRVSGFGAPSTPQKKKIAGFGK